MPESGQSQIQRDLLAPFRKRVGQKDEVFRELRQYSNLIISFIRELAEKQALPISVFATAALARGEHIPFTSIDLIYAADTRDNFADARSKITKIESALKDEGLALNHILITPAKNCTADLKILTKLLQAELIYGDESLLKSLKKKCREDAEKRGVEGIIEAILDEHTLRFKKYGSSPKMIEPNVKLSAGGLADLQTIFWIGLLLLEETETTGLDYVQAAMTFLRKFALLPERLIAAIPKAHAEILYARYSLFRRHLAKADRLESADQEYIAMRLGIKGSNAFRVYMRDYFAAATLINSAMYAVKKWRIELLTLQLPPTLRIPLDDQFYLKGGLVFCNAGAELTLADALKACFYQAEYEVTLSQSCREKILEITTDDSGFSGETIANFKKIISHPKSIATAIQSLNELNLLPMIAPQFEELQGFTERGAMHYYCADEHTIKAIVHFEELEASRDIFGKVFQLLPGRLCCRLALLFHDIAKPAELAGHPLLSGEIAAGALERFGYEEDTIHMVTFLIQNHLLMRENSFQREYIDSASVQAFAANFTSLESLQNLFLLTYADLSAVNPVYWTSWKQELLIQLFLQTQKKLEEYIALENEIELPEGNQPAALQSEHLAHLHAIKDPDYFSRYTEVEIGEHMREIAQGKPLSVLWAHETDQMKITVIANDNAYLLSKICGVFAINELNILNAMIFTRQDGIAILTFTISDWKKRDIESGEFHNQIEQGLSQAITGVLHVGAELNKARTRWMSIENRFFRRKDRVRIRFEEDDKFTVIEVFAPDRMGLLYHVAKKLSDLGLKIYFAKINTSDNEISDVFYTLDRYKKKVSTNYYGLIEKELQELIENLV